MFALAILLRIHFHYFILLSHGFQGTFFVEQVPASLVRPFLSHLRNSGPESLNLVVCTLKACCLCPQVVLEARKLPKQGHHSCVTNRVLSIQCGCGCDRIAAATATYVQKAISAFSTTVLLKLLMSIAATLGSKEQFC